jgi:hypothetical protein
VFFKHKYLTNLSVTPEDLVIAAVERKSHPSTRDLHPSTPTSFHHPSLKGPLRRVYRCVPQVRQSTLGAPRFSKGVTQPPWLTTSNGAHHYNLSDSTQHPTYLCTHQRPDTSVSPKHAQWESAAQYSTAVTCNCTLTYNANHMPDHAMYHPPHSRNSGNPNK